MYACIMYVDITKSDTWVLKPLAPAGRDQNDPSFFRTEAFRLPLAADTKDLPAKGKVIFFYSGRIYERYENSTVCSSNASNMDMIFFCSLCRVQGL